MNGRKWVPTSCIILSLILVVIAGLLFLSIKHDYYIPKAHRGFVGDGVDFLFVDNQWFIYYWDETENVLKLYVSDNVFEPPRRLIGEWQIDFKER